MISYPAWHDDITDDIIPHVKTCPKHTHFLHSTILIDGVLSVPLFYIFFATYVNHVTYLLE